MGIALNFYGFLRVFGVKVATDATRFYHFTYAVRLVVSSFLYWGLCYLDPPTCMTTRDWNEPKNYIAPNDDDVVEGVELEEVIPIARRIYSMLILPSNVKLTQFSFSAGSNYLRITLLGSTLRNPVTSVDPVLW